MTGLPLYRERPYIRIPKDMAVTETAPDTTPADEDPTDDSTDDSTEDSAGMPDEGRQDPDAGQQIALVNSSTDEVLRGAIR